MVSTGESRWRIEMLPGVLATYDLFYKPIFDALKRNNLAAQVPKLRISLGGEVDISFIALNAQYTTLISRLKADSGSLGMGARAAITFNPNGDAAVSRNSKISPGQFDAQCRSLAQFFQSNPNLLVGPSIYDRYSHVSPYTGAPDILLTASKFAQTWSQGLKVYCPGYSATILSMIENGLRKNFYFGEVA